MWCFLLGFIDGTIYPTVVDFKLIFFFVELILFIFVYLLYNGTKDKSIEGDDYMKRFVLTLNVVDIVRLVISVIGLIILVFVGFMFISGTWTVDSMIDGIQNIARWVGHKLGGVFSDLWDKNKAAIISALTVSGFGGIVLLIMDGN